MTHPQFSNRAYVPDRMGRVGRGRWVEPRDPFGRLAGTRDRQRPSFDHGHPTLLASSVGGGARNQRDDVAKIEGMLAQTGFLDTSKTNGPTGYYGERLHQAITEFQKQQGLRTDGLINPDGPTVAALRASVAPPGKSDNVRQAAETLLAMGRNGDTILAHLTPEEAELLHRITDGATINPKTGLPEFFLEYDSLNKWLTSKGFRPRIEDVKEIGPLTNAQIEEVREARNSPLPDTIGAAVVQGFELRPDDKANFHQKERKHIRLLGDRIPDIPIVSIDNPIVGSKHLVFEHPDGREIVFN